MYSHLYYCIRIPSQSKQLQAIIVLSQMVTIGLSSKLDKLRLKGNHEVPSTTDPSSPQKNYDTDDIDELDTDGQSILMGIISQLRLGSDLSRITLPTFILEKKSMLERITNFFQIPEILFEANATEDPLERFVSMVKWYLASWHIAPKAVKKPLNPILGEIFNCYWDDLPDGSNAYYLSEQTSHHPPKSSYFYLVPEHKIKVDGVVIPKSRFLGNSSAAIMEGWAHVYLGLHDELYIMNQPNVYCRGILFGKLRYELGDQMVVKCPTNGYEATIEFKVKGIISGTYDAIEGKILNLNTGEMYYTLGGKWNDIMDIKDVRTGSLKVFYDTHESKVHKPKVRPLDEQLDIESRKLWKPTIDALAARDHQIATSEKAKVEDEQRENAKKRSQDGVEFHPKLFRPVTKDEDELADLEYVLYKKLDLKDSPEELERHIFEVLPIKPGQNFSEKFQIPAYKKHSETP